MNRRPKILFSAKELANRTTWRRYNLTPEWLTERAKAGTIPAVNINGDFFFNAPAVLDRLIALASGEGTDSDKQAEYLRLIGRQDDEN